MRRTVTTILLFTMLLIVASPLSAVNKLEGYYETEASFRKEGQYWQFGPPGGEGMPRHYLELKYLSWPYKNLETFFKLRVQSNRDEYLTSELEFKRPGYLAAEGHMKLNGEKWESYIFARQNRFWIHDEPLLQLVDQNKLKNDNWGPQSSGVRADFWDFDLWKIKGIGGTFMYTDDGGTFNWTETQEGAIADGTDNFVIRLRKNSFKNRLELGTTILRKDWTNTSVGREYVAKSYNQVFAADVSFYPREMVSTGLSFGPLNLENSSWIAEYAISDDPYQIETSEVRSSENRFAFAAEARNIRLQNLIVHAWYYNVGENFRDYMSWRWDDNREFNRRLFHVEGSYLLPKKAVTATVSYEKYEKRIIDEEGGGLRPSEFIYAELYTEFINGFKGKLSYGRWHGFDGSGEIFDFTSYPNLYGELSVENSLVKVRIQGRIRDFDTFRQVFAYGYDMEFNATGKLKGYFRILNVNEETEARSTVFAQIRYDIGWGAECFLEYGEPWQSEHLVNTDHFVNEGNNDRLQEKIKLFLKLYF